MSKAAGKVFSESIEKGSFVEYYFFPKHFFFFADAGKMLLLPSKQAVIWDEQIGGNSRKSHWNRQEER